MYLGKTDCTFCQRTTAASISKTVREESIGILCQTSPLSYSPAKNGGLRLLTVFDSVSPGQLCSQSSLRAFIRSLIQSARLVGG